MERDTEALWNCAHAERAALARDLASLPGEAWRGPTLCGNWNVEEVTAHLTAAASVGQWRWIRSMVLAGFRPGVHNQRRLEECLGSTPAGTLQEFRAVIGSTVAPSSHIAAYLGEVVVHAQDIRYPLHLPTRPGLEALLPVAEFFAARNFTVPSRDNGAGLRLVAADAPFEVGAGPEVRGSLLGLVMCLAGRPAYLEELEGPGVALLRERITHVKN